jgi:dihydrodipicolinate reductase
MFTFWFHTSFIDDNHVIMEQHELDSALKDRSNKIYPKGFKVSLDFEEHHSGKSAPSAAASSAGEPAASGSKKTSKKKKKKKTRTKKQRSEVLEEFPSLKNL